MSKQEKLTFKGDISELKTNIKTAGYEGEWQDPVPSQQSQKYRFDGKNGEILIWYKNGTLQCQGKNSNNFRTALEGVLKSNNDNQTKKKIFIVHGHDTKHTEQVELFLRRLGLDPFILQNESCYTQTIIEALEEHIYQNTSFGIVLMTPDDRGYSKKDGEDCAKDRARQNVILEMGMLLAALGRKKVVILRKEGELEDPSDMNGILTLRFKEHIKEIEKGLEIHLKKAGFQI